MNISLGEPAYWFGRHSPHKKIFLGIARFREQAQLQYGLILPRMLSVSTYYHDIVSVTQE